MKKKVILLAFFTLLVTISCGFFSSSGDCVWNGQAKVWIDANSDGIKNDGELPLSGVAIHVDDIQNNKTAVESAVNTDEKGNASLLVWLPGCPKVALEIYPDVPNDYHLTTAGKIAAKKDSWGKPETNSLYLFGLAPKK